MKREFIITHHRQKNNGLLLINMR